MDETIYSNLSEYIAIEILKQPKREIAADEALLSSGLIGFLTLRDLELYVEDNYSVNIDDTELNADTFDTLDQLVSLIQERKF